MKKYLLLILAMFLLSSCFGGDESDSGGSSGGSGLEKIAGSGFEIFVPEAWDSADSQDLIVPVTGSIELAYRSTDLTTSFLNNIVIISEKLTEIVSSSDYAQKAIFLGTRTYSDFDIIDRKNITFPDDHDSRLYIFEAQYNQNTSKHLFFQTARVCGDKAYLLTIGVALGLEEDRYVNYENILNTFTCI